MEVTSKMGNFNQAVPNVCTNSKPNPTTCF